MDALLSTLTRARTRHAIGWACSVAALIGAGVAAVALAVTPAVGDDRFSYPMTSGGFVASELLLALQHLPLAVALLCLAGFAPRPVARLGLVGAAMGMGLLVVAELVAISAANSAADSSTADVVDTFFGIASTIIGLALLVAGVSLLRARWAVPLWLRGLPLTAGAFVFVVLAPAAGISDDALHWASIGWMTAFLLIGVALISLPLEQAVVDRRGGGVRRGAGAAPIEV